MRRCPYCDFRNALAEQQELRKRDIDKFQIVQFFKKHPDIDATQAADVFKSYQLDSGILNALKNQGKGRAVERSFYFERD